MGLLSREPGAPIADTEQGSGAEVEAELSKLFNELNGGLDSTNFDSAAAIDGSKLAAGSVPGSKLKNDTVTTAEVVVTAVPALFVSQDTSSSELAYGTIHASESLTLALSNLTVGDWVVVRFSGTATWSLTSQRWMTISIDDEDQGDLWGGHYESTDVRTIRFDYAFQATDTTHTLALKSRVDDTSPSFVVGPSTDTCAWTGDQRVLSAFVFPQKA